MQQRVCRINRVLVCGLAVLALVAVSGCPGNNTDFAALLSQLTGNPYINPADTVTIRLINEAGTGITTTLILEIDGVQQTFTCSSTQHVTSTVLPKCPGTVIAISENRVDTSGAFQGGMVFNGSNPAFDFTEGEFSCGQVITYTFTTTGASASVY